METSTQQISERLKLARKSAGYKSAKQFAQRNNIPPTTYSQHEAAKRSLSIEVAKNYCDILNINLCWLLTGETTEGLNILKDINPPLYKELCKYPTTSSSPDSEDYKEKLYNISRLQLTKIIDKSLLSTILARLQGLVKDPSYDISESRVAEYTANVYEDITNTQDYMDSQDQLLDIALKSLDRQLKKSPAGVGVPA